MRSHGEGPGRRSGPSRRAVPLLGLILFFSVAPGLIGVAGAQELLSWWKRGLIEVDLQPGNWATYASTEWSEGEVYADTLTVQVLAIDEHDRRWITVFESDRAEKELLLIDPARLDGEGSLLDALGRRLRWLPGGEIVEESVEELRDSRWLQRHFQDMFVAPSVTREAMADSTLAGETCTRESIRLHERREEKAPVGSSVMITEISSDAVLSPCVPIFSVVSAKTVTELSSQSAPSSNGHSRKMRPLRSVLEWHCVGFGDDGPTELPRGVERR